VLDDMVRAFVASGGRQILLLGAGFDCRAARLGLDARFFEVDHPATQARKRTLLDGAAPPLVEYVAWNFETDPLGELPARLRALGHDPARPTLTIWEGVTMYLTPEAIDASVAAVRALSAEGSELAFTYFDRAGLERPTVGARVVAGIVARFGEPYRFGWHPPSLPGWLGARGFALAVDRGMDAWAATLLPERWARQLPRPLNHVALARRTCAPTENSVS
jgi:methyltransferase (TIGR00027 family)